jgi:hypothetical protein
VLLRKFPNFDNKLEDLKWSKVNIINFATKHSLAPPGLIVNKKKMLVKKKIKNRPGRHLRGFLSWMAIL